MAISTSILEAEHPEYTANKDDWQLSKDTWNAGFAYIQKYLRQIHKREDKDAFEARQEDSHFDNFAKDIAKRYIDALWGTVEGVARDIEPTQLQPIEIQADRSGRALADFMTEVSQWSIVQSYAAILVTMTAEQADEDGNVLMPAETRPYWTVIEPLNIHNWEIDDQGAVDWVRISLSEHSAEPFSQPKTEQFWLTISREGWAKHDHQGELVAGDTYEILIDDNPVVPMAFIPFEPVENSIIGRTPFDDIARMNKTHFNLTSQYEHALTDHLFPLLGRQIDPLTDAPAPTEAVRKLVNEILYTGEAPPAYLELQTDGWERTEARLEVLEQNMYAAAGLRQRSGRAEMPESGISKAYNRVRADETAKRWGGALERGETYAFDLSGAWVASNFTGNIQYPSSYAVQFADEHLARFRSVREMYGDLSPTIVANEAMRTYRQLHSQGIREEDAETIEAEITANLRQVFNDTAFDRDIDGT